MSCTDNCALFYKKKSNCASDPCAIVGLNCHAYGAPSNTVDCFDWCCERDGDLLAIFIVVFIIIVLCCVICICFACYRYRLYKRSQKQGDNSDDEGSTQPSTARSSQLSTTSSRYRKKKNNQSSSGQGGTHEEGNTDESGEYTNRTSSTAERPYLYASHQSSKAASDKNKFYEQSEDSAPELERDREEEDAVHFLYAQDAEERDYEESNHDDDDYDNEDRFSEAEGKKGGVWEGGNTSYEPSSSNQHYAPPPPRRPNTQQGYQVDSLSTSQQSSARRQTQLPPPNPGTSQQVNEWMNQDNLFDFGDDF